MDWMKHWGPVLAIITPISILVWVLHGITTNNIAHFQATNETNRLETREQFMRMEDKWEKHRAESDARWEKLWGEIRTLDKEIASIKLVLPHTRVLVAG